MKNLVLLTLQNYKPRTKNFTVMFTLLKSEKTPDNIKSVIDSAFDGVFPDCVENTEELAFERCIISLLKNGIPIKIYGKTVKDFVKMNYPFDNNIWTYKVMFFPGNTFAYIRDGNDLSDIKVG